MRVAPRVAFRTNFAYFAPMSETPENLPSLEQRLAEHFLAFTLLNKSWPHGHTAIERAEIGRQRNRALAKILALQERIAATEREAMR